MRVRVCVLAPAHACVCVCALAWLGTRTRDRSGCTISRAVVRGRRVPVSVGLRSAREPGVLSRVSREMAWTNVR